MRVVFKPASGSVKPKQHWSSPETSRGTQRRFWSSDPFTTMGCGPNRLICTADAEVMPPPWLATSCIMIAASVTPRPAPPYSSGIVMPSQPASAIERWNSKGNLPSSSRASQYSSSKRDTTARTPSRIAAWSSGTSSWLENDLSIRTPFSDGRQRSSRGNQVRHVVHLAVDADRADIRLRRERRHDTACMFEIGVRRCEACIDGCDLIWVDRDPADESVPSRDLATFRKPFLILEIDIQGFERCSTSGTGGKQALRPRHLIGKGPAAVSLSRGERAERRAQIFPSPGHGHQPGVLAGIAAEADHRGGRFRRHHQQLELARGNAGGNLERVEIVRDEIDNPDAVDFRDQNAVEARANHGRQIFQGKPRAERIDPDQERPVPWAAAQQFLDGAAGERLSPWRDRVLEIEDQRVRTDPVGLGEFAFAVGRHEKQRAQFHLGCLIIKPFLRQYTTSSSR